MGFGGLLELKLSSLPHTMFREIIYAFKSGKYFEISETEKFELTADDVHDVFGLLNSGPKLDLVITRFPGSADADGEALKGAWREKYGIANNKSGIPLNKVQETLLESLVADDEFKKTFVLFVMSCFVAPVSGYVVDLRLLSAVEDVSRIKEFNWCQFVFSDLVTSVRETLNGRKNIRCCVVLLAITYFHRYFFSGDQF
ncbi:uncharacterized protein LOC141620072 [Silene latifolia]|uniref:uncharacterized protein LOC141620072 n=1 Tax=Silene latifolia TaxID=37657 RepID=UPI003D76CB37